MGADHPASTVDRLVRPVEASYWHIPDLAAEHLGGSSALVVDRRCPLAEEDRGRRGVAGASAVGPAVDGLAAGLDSAGM